MAKRNPEICLHLARLLDYPCADLVSETIWCEQRVKELSSQAAEMLADFKEYVESVPLERLQEIYTSTFDLQGICQPYVGYQLFGDSYQRSWFMAQLSGKYREVGFSAGSELPDHVAVILRFLAQAEDRAFTRELVLEGLIPAVEKMVDQFGEHSERPYKQVLQAVLIVLPAVYTRRNSKTVDMDKGGQHHV